MTYPLLAGVLLALVSGLTLTQPSLFTPYFGSAPPLVVMLAAAVAGYFLLKVLCRQFGFEILRAQHPGRGLSVALLASVPFMVLVTLADLAWRFPADINVKPPEALVFYPAMGFVAQIIMHLAPLTLLLIVVRGWTGKSVQGAGFWISAMLVAAIESGFQLVGGRPAGTAPQLDLFVAGHLLVFGVAELAIFRRYDYLSMYVFRLSYYGYWHLLWGGLRLEWLF